VETLLGVRRAGVHGVWNPPWDTAHQEQAGAILALLLSGLVLRALMQPLLALAAPAAPLAGALRAGLTGSGVLELAGASLALWLLAMMLRSGPPLRTRAGLWPLLPFFASAFVAFWLALGINVVGLVAAAMAGDPRPTVVRAFTRSSQRPAPSFILMG
jgi:hypothetical protein